MNYYQEKKGRGHPGPHDIKKMWCPENCGLAGFKLGLGTRSYRTILFGSPGCDPSSSKDEVVMMDQNPFLI